MTRKRFYIPDSTKEFYYEEFHISKRKGHTRRICAPSAALLAYQRSLLPELYRLFETYANASGVTNNIHGFLPNKNIVTAAREHIGYSTTIQMDISKCFDSITPQKRDPKLRHEDGTLAQGYATSPILANLYLIKPITDIKQQLIELGYDFVLTSYADDLAISVQEEDYNLINLIPMIVSTVMKKYNLEINKAKTRIRYAKYGNRKILGIMVGDTNIYPSKRLKSKIRAARHQNNGPSLGRLTTCSKMYLPRALRTTPEF